MGSVGAYKRLFVISRVKATVNWSSLESAVFGCVGLPLRQMNRTESSYSARFFFIGLNVIYRIVACLWGEPPQRAYRQIKSVFCSNPFDLASL